MLKANERVFDEVITGTGVVYTSAAYNELLGKYDRATLFAVADAVSGGVTSPTLTVQMQHSSDERNWLNKNGTAEINAQPLSTSATTPVAANDPTGNYGCAFGRLAISLGAATGTPSSRVRVYACLRDST